MIFDFVLGLLLLLAGRKMFWLSVGIMGFLVGIKYATELATPASSWMVPVFAIFLGVLGAVLAPVFEWIVVLAIGFFGGGYFVMNILPGGIQDPQSIWLGFVVGGVLGVLVMLVAFDWALIVISSLVGTALIIQPLNTEDSLRTVFFICILALGIWVQYLTSGPFTTRTNVREVNES